MATVIFIQIDDVERPATKAEIAHINEILAGAVEPTPYPPVEPTA